MDEIPELTLRPSRWKVVSRLLLSILAVAGFARLATIAGPVSLLGWFGVAFFALCGVYCALMLLPRASYLRVDSEGFTTCSLFRPCRMRWSDVESFDVTSVEGNEMVVLRMASHVPMTRIRAAAVAVSGYDGGLPDTYGMDAKDLAAFLNECRRRMAD